MVGKRRLNRRRSSGTRRRPRRRRPARTPLPFCSPGGLSVEAPPIQPLTVALNADALNQERNPANSIGLRSDRQSRKTPPARNIKSASQTPAHGGNRPCRANDTPIREIE